MAIPIDWTGEQSLDVVRAEFFFQNEKKNSSLIIGSTHGLMLMEIIPKNKIKCNLFTYLRPSH